MFISLKSMFVKLMNLLLPVEHTDFTEAEKIIIIPMSIDMSNIYTDMKCVHFFFKKYPVIFESI